MPGYWSLQVFFRWVGEECCLGGCIFLWLLPFVCVCWVVVDFCCPVSVCVYVLINSGCVLTSHIVYKRTTHINLNTNNSIAKATPSLYTSDTHTQTLTPTHTSHTHTHLWSCKPQGHRTHIQPYLWSCKPLHCSCDVRAMFVRMSLDWTHDQCTIGGSKVLCRNSHDLVIRPSLQAIADWKGTL